MEEWEIRYTAKDWTVMQGKREVIPARKIGVDCTDPNLVTLTGPEFIRSVFYGRPDILFAAGDKVVWMELKSRDDFETSIRGKRLARELRTGLAMADVVVLGLVHFSWWGLDAALEAVRAQTQGILVAPVPSWEGAFWKEFPELLASEANQRRVLAGSDYRKPKTALDGFPGVGPKTRDKLVHHFGSVEQTLLAYPHWEGVLGLPKAAKIAAAIRLQR